MNYEEDLVQSEDDYVKKITEKIDLIEDPELKQLVLRLVAEREGLINDSKIDPLTGVYNRRILDNVMSFTTVAICDIDNFKTINDTYGHLYGDKVLKLVADILNQNSRSNDYICRFGGDEFLVVFCGASEKVITNRMRDVAKVLSSVDALPDHKVTISVGVSGYKYGEDLSTTISRADEALYLSKESGKNCVHSYSEMYENNLEQSMGSSKVN